LNFIDQKNGQTRNDVNHVVNPTIRMSHHQHPCKTASFQKAALVAHLQFRGVMSKLWQHSVSEK
jgi:hypothetical protein